MPVLKETEWMGEVIWLGVSARADDTLRSAPLQSATLEFSGLTGARHGGETRPSCSRVSNLYAKGTEIRNVRQLSVLSEEEFDGIAADIGQADLSPGLVGANMILRGIPDFTHIPPSSRLQAPSGATLTIDMENRPCHLPGREIEAEHPGHGPAFKQAAEGRRGVTAWVERPGAIAVGDALRLFIPDQRSWQP